MWPVCGDVLVADGVAYAAAGVAAGIRGRLIAFHRDFELGFSVAREAKTVFHIGTITLAGQSTDGKLHWAQQTSRLNIDDLLVTPDAAYCVGHYEENDQLAQLRVISLRDGSILSFHQINGFPSYNGTSAAGDKLFVATREGRLVCFEGK